MLGSMSDVTQNLAAMAAGDPRAAADSLPLVYHELRKLGAARLADEKPGQTRVAPGRATGGNEPQRNRWRP
jgi:hypothetical protein